MKIVIKNNSIVRELGLQDFEEVTKSSKPYVVKFYSPTCYLCKGLKPIYEKLANEYSDQFKFGSVNTRKQNALTRMFGIEGVPEIFIIHNLDILKLQYPEDPDSKSGFSENHLVTYLNTYKDKKLNENG